MKQSVVITEMKGGNFTPTTREVYARLCIFFITKSHPQRTFPDC